MRILHTADWHLGHSLREYDRKWEHVQFLAWLAKTVEADSVDALIIAGDVFETSNPPAEAQQQYYDFLATVAARCPGLQVVVVGGNHDSADRLDAPEPVLRSLRVHVVGGLRLADANADLERAVVTLKTRDGRPGATVAAVPFLRPADLRRIEGAEDELVAGMGDAYARVLAAARQKLGPGSALLATGHLYMVGGKVSELSERKILGGNQHALSPDLFPADVAYTALGHLHFAQAIGGRKGVRYSGSPIPLSVTEASYKHQVCLVELHGNRLVGVESRPVPRSVDILRLEGLTLEELRKHPLAGAEEVPLERRPYLHLRIRTDGPNPGIRSDVEAALAGKAVRLTSFEVERAGGGEPLAETRPGENLRELQPEQVFRALYSREHQGDPAPDLLAAFNELMGEAA
jgi:exonuclease SbcD